MSDPGVRNHFTGGLSRPGDDPEDVPTFPGVVSRIWACATDDEAPTYCVHISREMTPDEVRETAAQLLAFVDRVEGLAVSEALIRDPVVSVSLDWSEADGAPGPSVCLWATGVDGVESEVYLRPREARQLVEAVQARLEALEP